jgi:hypothetical protein
LTMFLTDGMQKSEDYYERSSGGYNTLTRRAFREAFLGSYEEAAVVLSGVDCRQGEAESRARGPGVRFGDPEPSKGQTGERRSRGEYQ